MKRHNQHKINPANIERDFMQSFYHFSSLFLAILVGKIISLSFCMFDVEQIVAKDREKKNRCWTNILLWQKWQRNISWCPNNILFSSQKRYCVVLLLLLCWFLCLFPFFSQRVWIIGAGFDAIKPSKLEIFSCT